MQRICTSLSLPPLQRKFDHLESKYLTIKEEQEDIEYQFGKLKAATVLAKRDLREEELTYEALIVATQMESGKLSTRAKAFRRVRPPPSPPPRRRPDT